MCTVIVIRKIAINAIKVFKCIFLCLVSLSVELPIILHPSLLISSVVLKMFLMFDLTRQSLRGLSKVSGTFFSYSYACLDKLYSFVFVVSIKLQTHPIPFRHVGKEEAYTKQEKCIND